jgi:L-amino acid N-acyltransferase YncA
MTTRIRLATADDAPQVQAIYGPVVRDTVISFEAEPPSVEEMRHRIAYTLTQWPWLVCDRDGLIAGYAYASAHRARAAYGWSVDVSVYIDPAWRRHGIGRALYASLFTILRLQGFFNAYAGIALPNPGSVGLHEAVGFRPVGIYHGVGFKHGAWHDVGWWHLELQPKPLNPAPPASLAEVRATSAWNAALATGEPLPRD